MGSSYRALVSEWLGTMLLLATVIGSGIMAENLAAGNMAIALLGNTIPTGAILVVLITIFGPISGAHFNPAVTVAFLLRGEILPRRVVNVPIFRCRYTNPSGSPSSDGRLAHRSLRLQGSGKSPRTFLQFHRPFYRHSCPRAPV